MTHVVLQQLARHRSIVRTEYQAVIYETLGSLGHPVPYLAPFKLIVRLYDCSEAFLFRFPTKREISGNEVERENSQGPYVDRCTISSYFIHQSLLDREICWRTVLKQFRCHILGKLVIKTNRIDKINTHGDSSTTFK